MKSRWVFRKARECVDQISGKMIVEKFITKKFNTASMDLKKAYSEVDWNALLEVLKVSV